MEEEEERGPEEGYLLVRVHVPELNVQKCLQFPRDQLVWDVKQQCLAALPKVSQQSKIKNLPFKGTSRFCLKVTVGDAYHYNFRVRRISF